MLLFFYQVGLFFRNIIRFFLQVIATVDAKRALLDFCADHNDQYMALIEAHGNADDLLELRENVCRIYEVGKRREADECDDEQVHIFCIFAKSASSLHF